MKRKLLSVITALALCLSLLPGTAWAADETPAGVTIGSVNLEAGKYVVNEGVVEKAEGEIEADTPYLEYSADTGTLAVHGEFETTATITANSNLTITGGEGSSLSITSSSAPPIWLKNGSTLTLSGGVDFTGESSGGPPVIHSDSASTFAAAPGYSGSIVLTSTGSSPAVTGTTLAVESSTSIKITGKIIDYPATPGTAVLKSSDEVSLTSDTSLTIPSLTVEGRDVSLTNTKSSDRVYAGDLLTIKATGDVRITNTGDTAGFPAISGGANISAEGDVTISSNSVPIESGTTLTVQNARSVSFTGNSDQYYAFFSGPVTFKDCGEVTVTDAGSNSDHPLLKEGVTVTSNVPVKLAGAKYEGANEGMVYFKGGIWFDRGDAENNINPPSNPNAPPMVWKAGNGWVFYEPPTDENPTAKLTLDNAEYPDGTIYLSKATSVEVKGRNHIGFIETGSGSMDLNIRDGGTLNAIVSKSVEDEGVYKDNLTVYGKAKLLADYRYIVGDAENLPETHLTIPQGTELTISSDGLLEIENTEYLDNRGTLINNGTVLLTEKAAEGNVSQTIKSLGLTGTGTVVVGEWDLDNSQMTNVQGTYFNSGVKLLDPAGSLDLSNVEATDEENATSWATYGYKWEVTKDDPDDSDKITSAKLTLKEGFNAETVALPDAAVEIVTQGESIIGTLQIADGSGANHTQLTLSGKGPLNIQNHVEITGAPENSLTVARGAQVQVTGGVTVGAGSSVGGEVTVNGTLTAAGDSTYDGVRTGKVEVGSSGTLRVSGETGVFLAGMGTDSADEKDFAGAFTVQPGGRFEARCDPTVIMASPNPSEFQEATEKEVIIVPNGYLPSGCVLKFSDDRLELTIPGNGSPFSISVSNVPRPSGGGGGVSTYAVTVEKSEHGKVTSDRTNAGSGSTITLTVTPDTGYVLDALTVTDSRGNEITLTAQGDGKYTFTMPGRAVTVRAAFISSACTGGADCPSRAFSDLDTGEWYHEAVDYVLENDLMDGYDNGLFGPDDTLTRAQFVQILFNKEGKPVVNYLLRYDDVAPGAWYTEAVRWATSLGIAGGYGNGMFGPNDDITREQLVVMLWRYAGSPAATETELHFTDEDKASGYALEALRWAAESGVLNDRDGTLEPTGQVTRAETARMLKIFMEGQ